MSSIVTKLKGIDRSSLVIDGLKAQAVSSVTGQTIDFDAVKTEMHLRQNGADLDERSRSRIRPPSSRIGRRCFRDWTPFLDVTLAGKAGMVDGTDKSGLYGTSGSFAASLPISRRPHDADHRPSSFDNEGYLSGQFKLEIEKLGAWSDNAKQAFPQLQSTIETARKLLRALASGADRASVDLVVDHGRATISGFILSAKSPRSEGIRRQGDHI